MTLDCIKCFWREARPSLLIVHKSTIFEHINVMMCDVKHAVLEKHDHMGIVSWCINAIK